MQICLEKKNSDDVNHCLHNKSGSHGVANANSFDFIVLLVDCHLLRTNSDAFSKEEYILGILTVVVCCNRFITFTFDFYGLLSAKQRRNLCFGPPPVYQDLSTRHEWSVHVKKPSLQIRPRGFASQDERKFKMHFR